MHDLFLLKHCICVHTDMINAIMAQGALVGTRVSFCVPLQSNSLTSLNTWT